MSILLSIKSQNSPLPKLQKHLSLSLTKIPSPPPVFSLLTSAVVRYIPPSSSIDQNLPPPPPIKSVCPTEDLERGEGEIDFSPLFTVRVRRGMSRRFALSRETGGMEAEAARGLDAGGCEDGFRRTVSRGVSEREREREGRRRKRVDERRRSRESVSRFFLVSHACAHHGTMITMLIVAKQDRFFFGFKFFRCTP